MASAKTGSFYLTESVLVPAGSADGSRFSGTIDLSSYVNVPTGQAVAIDKVDFIFQVGNDFGSGVAGMVAADGGITAQLVDLNPGDVFVRADNHSLIASAGMSVDFPGNIATHTQDLYPDNFGTSALSEMFLVVNDTLYFTVGPDQAASGASLYYCTVRVRARVVKLGSKDWMALAIQSTATE